MRKRVTYRPGKAQGAFGTIWGGIFVLIGLFVVIPTFGPFGIIWTLGALGITVINALHAFGKKYVGPEIRIEEDKEGEPVPSDESHDHIQSTVLDAQGRLEEYWLNRFVSDTCFQPEELAQAVEQVTLDQVVQTACQVELDSIYTLRGKEG